MNNKKFIVIPQCTDLNRGDQALVWETVRIAKDAGFDGEYHIMSGSVDDTMQSCKQGYIVCDPILKHPSRFFKKNDNIKYGLVLKIKWGIVSLFDLLISLLILMKTTRKMLWPFLPQGTKNTLSLYEKSEAIFVKGGGFIHGFGGIISSYYIYFVLYHIKLAQKYKKPVYIMPNSFGPFKGPFVPVMVKKILSHCRLVTARESISAVMLLKDLGINVPVFPDLGFFLQTEDKEKMRQYLIKKGVPLETKKCVAITMRPYRFPGSSNPEKDYNKYKRSFSNFIRYLDSKGYYKILIEHTLSHNTHESDSSCIKDILPLILGCKYTFISDDSFDCRQLKSIYSNCDYVIGTRFHSVIFSIGEGVAAIAVTYGGNKGDGIMKDMELSNYAIPISYISSEILIEKFNSLINDEKNIKKKISNYNKKSIKDRNRLIKVLSK